MRPRRSARALLLDEAGRVLLIRFAVPRASGGVFEFWVTPGGEIEPGETPAEAARRECREELGLELTLAGPVREEENCFEHEGEWRSNHDTFFTARCQCMEPRLEGVTAAERAVMQELRWWSRTELADTAERIFPAWLPVWPALG